jgi:hypothetical protein
MKMNNFLLSEKIYKLSETEILILTDFWDVDKQRLWIKADIRNTNPVDELYRISFVNKLRGYFHFTATIMSNHWIHTNLDRPELEDDDKFSDIGIYITKNDKLIKKITYKTPHISELQNRFLKDIHKFDGKYIFNNINKEPIFICGTPGGGTSYMAKMLQYCGLFIGDDVCRFEDRKTFESTSITILQWYFVRQIIKEKLYKDADNNIDNIFQLISGSDRMKKWLINKGDGSIDSNELELFEKEFIKVLPIFWGNNELDLNWGFKKPFNMIWIKYFISMFPNAKVLIIDKKKEDKIEGRSFEGKLFEKMDQKEYELFTEIGDDLKCNNRKCDFDKMNKDVDYFNEVMEWCGLPTKTKEDHYQMLVDLKYDDVKLIRR